MSMRTITRPTVAILAASLMLALAGCSGPSTALAPSPTTASASPSPVTTTEPAATPSVPVANPESTAVVGSPTTSGPKAVDDAFLASWKTFFPHQSDGVAIAQALNICDEFKIGTTYAQEVKILESNGGVTPGDAAFMIGTAEISYCPEFSGNM